MFTFIPMFVFKFTCIKMNAWYNGSISIEITFLISPYAFFRMIQMDMVVTLKNVITLIFE
jgi:hypothetical protein